MAGLLDYWDKETKYNIPDMEERLYSPQINPYLNSYIENMGGNGVKGLAGSATVGATMPMFGGETDLSATASGAYGRWKGDNQMEKIRELNLDRMRAMYSKGNNSYGVDFNPNDALNNFMLRAKFGF